MAPKKSGKRKPSTPGIIAFIVEEECEYFNNYKFHFSPFIFHYARTTFMSSLSNLVFILTKIVSYICIG